MATLINNSGVQYYANKMVQAENRKVGSKSLPTALNDIDSALDEMKILFDAEYGSALDMKLENTENIFSVGTGSEVDKKADVENSFTDVEIKGTTLVNIYGKGFSDVANINKGAGEIVDDGYYKLVANGSYRNAFLKKGKFPMKPSTVYTVVMFVRKETLVGSKQFILSDGASDSPFKDSRIDLNGIGTYTKKVTTLSDFDSTKCGFRGYIPPQTTSGELEFKVMLLEGDWTNYPIPNYFEGMKSVGEVEGNKIEVSSVGKNLFDGVVSSEYSDPNINFNVSSDGVLSATNKTLDDRAWRYDRTQYRMKLKKGNYTITLETITPSTSQHSQTLIYKKGATDSLCMFGRSTMDRVGVNSQQISLNEDADIGIESKMFDGTFRIQIEKGSQSTTFTPYKLNKKEILLNEPLRGLPNGVKDTIEKVNGEWKIVRRFGEYFLNGDESWQYRNQGDNTTTYSFTFNSAISSKNPLTTNDGIIISDCVIGIDNNSTNGVEGISIKKQGGNSTTTNEIYIEINRSRLSTLDTVGLKEWLTKNPIKLIYELATPIIEDISPVTLQCWKNGTISIDEILPVESTHTVALNKPAQIKRNIEELTQLRNKVKSLEEQYDQIALEQAHQLELINHSFELDYI